MDAPLHAYCTAAVNMQHMDQMSLITTQDPVPPLFMVMEGQGTSISNINRKLLFTAPTCGINVMMKILRSGLCI